MTLSDPTIDPAQSQRRPKISLMLAVLLVAILLTGAAAWTAARASGARADATQTAVLRKRLFGIQSGMRRDLATMKMEQAGIVRLTARHEELTRIRRAETRRSGLVRARRRHRRGHEKVGVR